MKCSWGCATRAVILELLARAGGVDVFKPAILLGAFRKLAACVNHGDQSPIRSLRYFVPVIDEVRGMGMDVVRSGYFQHLERRLCREEQRYRAKDQQEIIERGPVPRPAPAKAQPCVPADPIAERAECETFLADLHEELVAVGKSIRKRAGYEKIAAEIEDLAAKPPLDDLEAVEERLEALEGEMIVIARSRQSDEELLLARRDLDLQLRPYRGKMTAEQLSMLEKQFLERRLLESAGLPRLSLYFLH